ncbi:DctP family TRAP transporter solute-binding subunit [Afifella sp. JA880]|uniref:DctP family TRAP transporter solute-binding subunit n=1 Tax=Afifella sp. JA880 TaxID=2975280 RepID=UPI0021BAFB5B|nr:DctP family TRAP transporter solute-binding subunit [Afifella sp. JA880]MCT8269009.1 DctP family TRAP transporter solute-binding subunit [Afifella sp. JA880]
MKTTILTALAMSLLASTAMAQSECQSGETLIKYSHVSAPTGNPKGEMATALAKRVNEEMDGQLCIQVYPSSQLYNDDEVMEALAIGDIQLASPDIGKLGAYTAKLDVFNLPFLFEDTDAVSRFTHSETGDELLKSMTDNGFVGLAYVYNGLRAFSANRPLIEPSDLNGLKIRATTSDVSIAMIKALGANPQPLAWSEAFGALQTGVVDGQENTWSNIYTGKLYEVQDGVTETNHQFLTYILVTSEDFLGSLDDEVRDKFLGIVGEVSDEYNEKATAINEESKKRIQEAGVTVRTLSPEQRQKWVDAVKPVWEEFEDGIGKDVIEAAVASNKS